MLAKYGYGQSTYKLLLFYVNINYTTVPICHGYKYTADFFCVSLCRFCLCSTLIIKFQHTVYNRTYSKQNMFRENRLNVKNNVQQSKVNNKHSALRFIYERSSVAYVNQFEALPNNQSVYLY
jgi:hypothetical protein